MKIALYARVSSMQQAHDQTIEQQLERLQAVLATFVIRSWWKDTK